MPLVRTRDPCRDRALAFVLSASFVPFASDSRESLTACVFVCAMHERDVVFVFLFLVLIDQLRLFPQLASRDRVRNPKLELDAAILDLVYLGLATRCATIFSNISFSSTQVTPDCRPSPLVFPRRLLLVLYRWRAHLPAMAAQWWRLEHDKFVSAGHSNFTLRSLYNVRF